MHSDMAISPTPAVPTRPSPAKAGRRAVPKPPATAETPPRTPALVAILLAASRANPPDQTMTISVVFRFQIELNKKELNPIIVTS